MKFKKKTVMAVSLIAGLVMLTTSAFANYVNSSGYEDCKRAVKKLLKEDNYTLKLTAEAFIDDTSLTGIHFTQLLDTDGDVKLNWFLDEISDNHSYTSREYFQDGELIRISKYTDEAESYYIDDENPDLHHLFKINEDDQKTVDKAVRFAELLADMVVGDLKNNMILIDTDDTGDTYAIDLEGYQMPELISAGLSLVGSANSNPENFGYSSEELAELSTLEIAYRDPMLLLGEEPVIDNAKAQAKLDNEGRILDASAEFTISGVDYNGNPHTFRMTFAGTASDYDTTVPERIDISGKSVRRASQWRQERIAFIDEELSSEDLSEEEIENLNEEKASLQKQIEMLAQGKTAITEESEVTADTAEAEEAINMDENSSSVVIGGADSLTSVTLID